MDLSYRSTPWDVKLMMNTVDLDLVVTVCREASGKAPPGATRGQSLRPMASNRLERAAFFLAGGHWARTLRNANQLLDVCVFLRPKWPRHLFWSLLTEHRYAEGSFLI